MQKNRILIFLIIVYVLLDVVGFVYENKSFAQDGTPDCCFFIYPAKPFPDPKEIPKSFGEKELSELKILSVQKGSYGMRPKKFKIALLAVINKSTVVDLKKEIISEVTVSDYAAKNLTIKEGDYFLLIPMSKYDESGKKNMYDFVKIPAKLIK